MQSLFRSFALACVLGFMATGLCGCGGGGGQATTMTTTTTTTTNPNCLCVFDVDRTLTASQHDDCPNTTVKTGVEDIAYGGGTLKLAQLATNMDKTFCSKCYHSIVTRGNAGGADASGHNSKEREIIFKVVGPRNYTLSEEWQQWQPGPGSQSQDPNWNATSSVVFFVNDGHKNECVKSVIEWFEVSQGVRFDTSKVHFFDDRADNVKAFEGTGHNAHQVACAGRDPKIGNVGKCGATVAEIVESTGGVISLCEHPGNTEVVV